MKQHPGSTPIDMVRALERTGGEMDFLEELIKMFIVDFKEKYDVLVEAVNRKDAAQVQEIAHSFKGSSANLGLSSLQETFFQLEKAGRNQNLSDSEKTISLLKFQFDELTTFWENLDQIELDENVNNLKTNEQNHSTESRFLLADDSEDKQLLSDSHLSQTGIGLDLTDDGDEANTLSLEWKDFAQDSLEKIKIDESIIDLLPTYLENRRSDIQNIISALNAEDMSTIITLANKMKGTGLSYGFEKISQFGKLIESSAMENDFNKIRHLVKELKSFLENVEVEY
ncbi:Hpt domain-containing protein [Acidobacteriota bacterium]